MTPDPSVLGSDIVLGPLALLAFIAAALGYAAREWRKGRDARVEALLAERELERAEHEAEVTRLEVDRDQARSERDAANRRVDKQNAETIELKELHMLAINTEHARVVKAREMLVELRVPVEDLP